MLMMVMTTTMKYRTFSCHHYNFLLARQENSYFDD
jgi:hypothetical protein